MDPHIDRVKRELAESIDRGLAATTVDVVVMGPSLDSSTPSAKLRRDIIRAAKAYGASIKPEHRGLSQVAAERLRAGYHLARFEWELVDISDLAVLIPDSPGSLCELGLFADSQRFGPKMLIFANKDHPQEGSYVTDGPLTAADHNGAEVHHIDYADFDLAWSYVQSRIERVQAHLSMRRLT